MQFIDSHIHLQDYKTKSTQQIIADLSKKGFKKVVCVSTSPTDWDNVAALAAAYPQMIVPAFGVHPWYLAQAPQNWPALLKERLLQFPRAQIGECGLDRLKAPQLSGQKEAFAIQLKLAQEFNRPLNIHALKADEWLREFWPQMPPKFMLHGFGGSLGLLLEAIKAGAMISFSPAVLRRKNYPELIEAVPLDRLLLESDAPYMSDYSNVSAAAQKIATLKNISLKELVDKVYVNFEEFNCGK